jgi:FkbM family methyltransferase
MSQFGADHWVLSQCKTPGYYVDVGCHDGIDISNTYLLDKNGWKGLCIDPFPKNFDKRSATVVKAVVYSSNDKEIEFDYSIEDPGCSGIEHELGVHKQRLYTTTTIQKHKFTTRTLESILEEHNVPRRIEYMNMDIEGAEYEALKVFPFEKYSFKLLTIEHNYEEPKRSMIRQLLESKGYTHTKSVHVDDWYVNTKWIKNKVIISLTSIPSRLENLPILLQNLENQTCHEIWVNIPREYTRFPDWYGTVPSIFGTKLKINRDCEDLGPGTKVIGPASHLDPDDLIVYLDDDTNYDSKLITNLLKWWKTDPKSAWGLSGFHFQNYFEKRYPRHHGVPVDVLEGYGAVLVKAGWIQSLVSEFKELREEAKAADDVILSNLLAKQGIQLKTVCTPDCHIGQIKQLEYGFGPDALHHQFPGGHHENYANVLKSLEDKGKSYFSYKCS